MWVNFENFNFNSRLLKVENFRAYLKGLSSELKNRDKQARHLGASIPENTELKVLKQTTSTIVGRFVNRNDNVVYLYAKVWDDNPMFKLQEDEYYL